MPSPEEQRRALLAQIEDGSLKTLNMMRTCNNTGEEDAKTFAPALQNPNSRVTYINMASNLDRVDAMDSADTWNRKVLVPMLNALLGSCVTSINLNDNYSEDSDMARYLFWLLAHPDSGLRSISIRRIGLTEEEIIQLTNILKSSNCSITSLFMGLNIHTKAAAEAVASLLKDPGCNLILLDIAGILEQYPGPILDAMQDNKNLLYLSFTTETLYETYKAWLGPSYSNMIASLERNQQDFVQRCKSVQEDEELTPENRARTRMQCLATLDNVLATQQDLYALYPNDIDAEQIDLAEKCIKKLDEQDCHLILTLHISPDLADIVLGYLKEESAHQHFLRFLQSSRDFSQRSKERNQTAEVSQTMENESKDNRGASGDGGSQHDNMADNSPQQSGEQLMDCDTYSEHKTDYQCQPKAEAGPTAEDWVMTILAWIKDHTTESQRKIFSSDAIQPLLQLVEALLQPYKFITDQFSSTPKEIFEANHKKYYDQEEIIYHAEAYAQPHIDSDASSPLLNTEIALLGLGLGWIIMDQLSPQNIDLHPQNIVDGYLLM